MSTLSTLSTASKSTAQTAVQPGLFDSRATESAQTAMGGLDEPPFRADDPGTRVHGSPDAGTGLEDVQAFGGHAVDSVIEADAAVRHGSLGSGAGATSGLDGVSPASDEPGIVHPARVVAVAGGSPARCDSQTLSVAAGLNGPAIDTPACGRSVEVVESATSGPGSSGLAPGPAAPVRRGPLLDAGWLFLIAGIAIIAFTVLVPAVNDLDEARFYRERIQQVEKHRGQRIERYQEYLEAINSADDALIRSLAAVQLNLSPEGTQLLEPTGQVTVKSASPFPALEPPPLVLADKPPTKPMSTLEKWATDDRSRLWLLAGGSLCILIGLLPTARR